MSLQNSFSEIRSRSSPAENMYVIENITLLQRDIRHSIVAKRNINSLHSESEDPFDSVQDENLAPARKKNSLKKVLFDDTTSQSSVSFSLRSNTTRPPLLPLDMNSLDMNSVVSGDKSVLSRRNQKNRNRITAAKLNNSRYC
jgi:hypothetical protein